MNKEATITVLENFLKNILKNDFDNHFEYELYTMINKKLPTIFNQLKINNKPIYLEVKNIDIKTSKESVFNDKIKLSKYNKKGIVSIEPCFITNIPIMEIYYNIKNIEYKKIELTFKEKQKFNDLKHILNFNLYINKSNLIPNEQLF